MDLGKSGWLSALLEEAVAAHAGVGPQGPDDLPAGASPRARARAFLRRRLRTSGLTYGTPVPGDAGAPQAADGGEALAAEVQLFRAVLRTFAGLALDVAALVGAPAGPRRDQVALLLTALVGRPEEAAEQDARLRGGKGAALSRRAWGRLEDALAARAMALAGDPAYGLVLHNGAVYAEAQLLGRLAVDYFTRGGMHAANAERRLLHTARQKALLVQLLTALSGVDAPPSAPARRAILRQVEDLRLPGRLASEVRASVKAAFEHPRPVAELVREVRSQEMKHFLLEQALLASLVDGRRSRGERAFLEQLAGALGVGAVELAHLEVQVAEFYAKNRSAVDVFTVSAAAGVLGEELVDEMQGALVKNWARLLQELRETGELSVLLARAAKGDKLTGDEKARMRAQLIDVAKAIPALAIFAAPGGLLLLVALAKVLPFNLLPSAFQDAPPPAPRAPERKAG